MHLSFDKLISLPDLSVVWKMLGIRIDRLIPYLKILEEFQTSKNKGICPAENNNAYK